MAPPDFVAPDWTEPIDIEAYVRACGPEQRVRGLFFEAAHKVAVRSGLPIPAARRIAFKDYPVADYVRLIGTWAATPGLGVSPRQFLRTVGHDAFPGFRSTVAGKVLLAAAGGGIEDVLGVSGRAYSISITQGSLVPRVGQGSAELQLRQIPTFADSFHVGVFEGVLRGYGRQGTVSVRRHSLVDVDLLLEWR